MSPLGAAHRRAAPPARRAAVAGALALVLLSACRSSDPRRLPLSGPLPQVGGTLVFPRPGGLWSFRPSTATRRLLRPFSPGAYVGDPAASPDGYLIAYTALFPNPDGSYPEGTDVYIMGADGQTQRRVVAYDAEAGAAMQPAWDHRGQRLFVVRQNRKAATRIEEVALDGTRLRVVVSDGSWPTVASDGAVAYLTTDRRTRRPQLWVREPGGPPRLLVGGDFLGLVAPRFAPDGRRIVFSGFGGPPMRAKRGADAGGPGRAVPRQAMALARWLDSAPVPRLQWRPGPARVQAHGIPWDLWVVARDGSGLERLTEVAEDGIVAAWSPDGRWVAFTGELGLFLYEMATARLLRLTDESVGGGITWLREPGP
ncbi:MAG: hypothetical protein QN158_14420 [Armatimonadota bacterium]|nr:hypothetical protein [Armatimonadota bacterium]